MFAGDAAIAFAISGFSLHESYESLPAGSKEIHAVAAFLSVLWHLGLKFSTPENIRIEISMRMKF